MMFRGLFVVFVCFCFVVVPVFAWKVSPSWQISPSFTLVVDYELTVESPSVGGSCSPSVGSHWYGDGTVVDLVAAASFGYDFVAWEVDGVNVTTTDVIWSVTMDEAHTVKAYFELGGGLSGSGTPQLIYVVLVFVFVMLDLAVCLIGGRFVPLVFGCVSLVVAGLSLVQSGNIPFSPYPQLLLSLMGIVCLISSAVGFKNR